MASNRPAGTTYAVFCAVIVVLAILATSVQGAIPPPSADEISAMQQQAMANPGLPESPDDETCLSESVPRPRIVQIKKSWVESWAVGNDRDESDGSPGIVNGYPGVRDDGPPDRSRNHDGDSRNRHEPPKIIPFGNDRCIEKVAPSPRGTDKPSPQPQRCGEEDRGCDRRDCGPWKEIDLLLKSFNDLIEFYEEQGRWADKERALKQRIDICRKITELHLLAETDGPGAAMQEFYRSIHRPDRAIELDLHNIERDLDRLAQEYAEVEAEVARLVGRQELLEQRMSELNDRREQRRIDLSDIHEQMQREQANDDEEDEKDYEEEDYEEEDDAEEEAAAGLDTPPDGDLCEQLATIENALVDQSLDGARRARIERRHLLVLNPLDRDTTGLAAPDGEPGPAYTGANVHQDSGPALDTAALLDILEPSPSTPYEYAWECVARARQWLQQALAEMSVHAQQANARQDQALASSIMGPPQDCNQ